MADNDGNPRQGAGQGATASYWVVNQDQRGTTFMWNCEACGPGMGLSGDEALVVAEMNAHMADKHAGSGYVPPPIPE